jgi:molecular chaperone GrpE
MTKAEHKHHKENKSDAGVSQDSEQKDAGMITIPEAEYQAFQEQIKEQKDKYVRILAEFENARKRQDRERAEFIKYANEGLMIDFLNVVDDLERTVSVAKEKHQDYDSFLKGVEMVMKHVTDLLKKQGVELMDPVGKLFDPYAHEIIAQEPTEKYENGTVMELFQNGYKLGDRVIRTAKVKVAINNTSEEKTT